MTDERQRVLERWKTIRWWRTVSTVLQHNAVNLTEFVRGRIDQLDEAWEARFEEAAERLTSFVAGLGREQLGTTSDATFLRVAEKYRRRELRAMVMAHLATEMVAKARARAAPILEALAELDPDDHRAALAVGDLPGFDESTRSLLPNGIASAAAGAVDEAVESRSTAPVDELMARIGVSRVDNEFRNLLAFDEATVAHRLEQAIALRSTTIDLRGDEPVVRLPETDAPIVTRHSRAAQG